MSFLVDLWIILSYLRDTEYYLVAINLNYVQADFFDMFSYYYLYKNSLISYYSLILFYCRPINNTKQVRFLFLPNKYIQLFYCFQRDKVSLCARVKHNLYSFLSNTSIQDHIPVVSYNYYLSQRRSEFYNLSLYDFFFLQAIIGFLLYQLIGCIYLKYIYRQDRDKLLSKDNRAGQK